jgi:hypothetical protein
MLWSPKNRENAMVRLIAALLVFMVTTQFAHAGGIRIRLSDVSAAPEDVESYRVVIRGLGIESYADAQGVIEFADLEPGVYKPDMYGPGFRESGSPLPDVEVFDCNDEEAMLQRIGPDGTAPVGLAGALADDCFTTTFIVL